MDRSPGGELEQFAPKYAQQISHWLKTLSTEWQRVDYLALRDVNDGTRQGLLFCIRAGLVRRRWLMDVSSCELATVVIEADATGSYDENRDFKPKLAQLWSHANTWQSRPDSELKLTPDGCEGPC